MVRGVALWVVVAACGRVGFDPLDGAATGGDDGRLSLDAPADCPAIGNVCADGTVFGGISPDGNVPMFVEPTTVFDGPWSFGTGSPPATEVQTSLFDPVTGAANTAALSLGGAFQDADAGTSGIQPHEAANYCTDLTLGGHTDWYLPAFDELRVLFTNTAAIGGFNNNEEYWTSTEDSDCPLSCALLIQYPNGNTIHFRNKFDYRGVRCVRK